MKVNTPAAYSKIFPIYTGTALTQYQIPAHRGLLISASTTSFSGWTGANMDGITLTVPISSGSIVLPAILKEITTAQAVSTVRIYGLL